MLPSRASVARTLVAVVAAFGLVACDSSTTPRGSGSPTVTPHLTPAPSGLEAALASSPCDVGDVGQTVTIETLRRIAEPCVEPENAVIVRCDPALDPIAIVDAGTDAERVFLGGSFAVPVDEVPQRAAALGFAATGRYYLDQDDNRRLYLEAGGRAERWLALPRPRLVEEPPTALMVGDSILDGSSAAVTEALPGWALTIDALIGRSSSGGIGVVEATGEGSNDAPDVAVLELGTNDPDAAVFRTNASRILTAPVVAQADLIVWVTAHNPDPITAAVNREIALAVAAVPNATIADWDRRVPPEALQSDGVHLSPGNEGLFAEFLTPVLETWRAAVHRRGPTRCVDAARAALP